ncbi:hypothetical protein EAH72_34985 [Pseudomonas caspiana]|nr:hypothetical protein EAH72_34985 [Pseudomonas caspiana]
MAYLLQKGVALIRLCSQSIDLESKIIASRVQLLAVSKNEILFDGWTCSQLVHVATFVAKALKPLSIGKDELLLSGRPRG